MKNTFSVMLIVSFCVFSLPLYGAATEPTQEELIKEIRELKSRIAALEKSLSRIQQEQQRQKKAQAEIKEEQPSVEDMEAAVERHVEKHVLKKIDEDIKRKASIDELGLKLGISATMVVQGAVDANNAANDKEDVTDGSYQVDVQFAKQFGDYGYGFAQLECGDGVSVMDELEVYSNVDNNNDDTDNNAKLTKFWYQHVLLEKQISVAVGKWDPTDSVDTNTIANDDSCQFLAEIFNNSPVLTYDLPSKAPGIWATLSPESISWLELEGMVFTGDGEWEDMTDHLQMIPQVTIKPKLGNDLEGHYRFYGWYRNTDYTKWSNRNEDKEHRYGFGLSVDQQLSDIFALFGRYGWEDPDVYDPGITSSSGSSFSLEQSWSAGFQLSGQPWNRPDDRIAAGFGSVIPSDKYKEYGGTNLKADDEYHAELYYYWRVNEYLAFSPDVQFIWNPFGSDYVVNGERRDHAITVIGCRGHFDF